MGFSIYFWFTEGKVPCRLWPYISLNLYSLHLLKGPVHVTFTFTNTFCILCNIRYQTDQQIHQAHALYVYEDTLQLSVAQEVLDAAAAQAPLGLLCLFSPLCSPLFSPVSTPLIVQLSLSAFRLLLFISPVFCIQMFSQISQLLHSGH